MRISEITQLQIALVGDSLYYIDGEDSLFNVMKKINANSICTYIDLISFSTNTNYNNAIIVTDFRARNLYYETVVL